jgi:hypothetical protein
MAKRPEKFRTFAEEQTANSLWLVCPDAAIPVGSVDLGRKIAESMPCEHDHAVITLDLRPRNWSPLVECWQAHAYGHSHNSVTVGVLEPRISDMVSRMEWDGASPLTAMVNRAIAHAETRRDRPLVSVAV